MIQMNIKLNIQTSLLTILSFICIISLISCEETNRNKGISWHSNAPFGTLPPGFEGFPERWNKQIHEKLLKEELAKKNDIKILRDKYFKENNDSIREKLQTQLISLESELTIIKERLAAGDYIKFAKASEIPTNLVWENGLNNPEIGDPKAKKGGVLRVWAAGSYPDTFRAEGPNSNSTFRAKLYDEISVGLIGMYPVTGKIIPGLAHKWAEAPDKKTVYFELDPDARYSDGSKVKTIDLLVNLFIRTSEYTKDVFFSNFYYQNCTNITIYDSSRFSVTIPTAKPLLPYYCSLFHPSPPHFYSEFGPNYVERYQWRVPPTTGAYTPDPNGLIRGRQITMTRVKDWWAKDKKFTKYTNNVDKIVYQYIAEPSKALELFRIGELDIMDVTKPELWHDRMEIPEVHHGYINRATFYNIYPRSPLGIYLNCAKAPFDDKNVRLGTHHAFDIENVINTTFRGDFQRLNSFCSGFGKFTNPHIKARPYSPELARSYFAKAGYTIPCPDGILRKPDGTRLQFTITYSNASPTTSTSLVKLKEDARKCGLDIMLDPLDSTVAFRKIMEKRTQASFMAWGISPPHPLNEQNFHSRHAYDERGGIMPYTNNINSFADKEMDCLLDAETNATSEEALLQATWAVQQKIHDEAIWIPAWTTEFTRLAYWRWVCWPDSETTKFSHPSIFDPVESYLYWIDTEAKKETLKAKRNKQSFPESDQVYDQFRFTEEIDSLQKKEPKDTFPSVPSIPHPDMNL